MHRLNDRGPDKMVIKAWHKKLAIDTIKAAIPGKPLFRRLHRRIRPYRTDPANDSGLLTDGLAQIAALRRHHQIAGATVLELGSGWLPIIPLLFHLAGAKSIVLTDQERLLDDRLWTKATAVILANSDKVRDALGVRPRLEALRAGNFRYLAPFDPAEIPDASVHFVISRAVLEHVRPRNLARLMSEFRRMLKPDGLMSHIVDMSDHWEHRDKSICRVNFLRFGDRTWSLAGLNPQNYQNRLRRREHVQLIERSGFTILDQSGEPDPPTLQCLQTLPLARRFRTMPKEELAIITCHIVAVRN